VLLMAWLGWTFRAGADMSHVQVYFIHGPKGFWRCFMGF